MTRALVSSVFEVHRHVWDDDPVEGGRFVMERIGAVIARSKHEAELKIKAAGYAIEQVGRLDTYHTCGSPIELLAV